MNTAGPSRAFVTLVTNADYVLGAKALVRSLRLTESTADIVVMHTGAVTPQMLEPIGALGARLVEAEHLPTSEAFNARHSRKAQHEAAPFTKGGKPEFHTPLDNFIKLRLWQLTEYRSVVFIDADAIVVQNIDKLFEYPEFCAAPNVYESLSDFHRLNSGVFTARPSEQTFEAMLERLDEPDRFWKRTDQTFLQEYFPDWQGLPVFFNMLQYVWFNMPELWDWEQIKVIHYQYEKPWQQGHERAHLVQPLIDFWNTYAGEGEVPDLRSIPNP